MSSLKKINSNSKKKIISSSKKPTKSFIDRIFNYVVYILTYFITTMITTTAFGYFYSNNFKIFASLVISTLSISYMYNNHIKTPTKVDSQKNIIKLPLSTFKSYVKKLVKMIEPLLSVMSSSLKLFTVLILIKTIYELSKQYNKSYEKMIDYLLLLFNLTDNKEKYKLFLENNIERIVKLCFPNIDINNPNEVNRIIRENSKLLNKIASILFNEQKPNEIVKVNFIKFAQNYNN